MSHLTSVDSIEYLVKEGFSSSETLEIIPTELIRRILGWCIDYYFESKRLYAPSKEAILSSWGEKMQEGEPENRVTLDDSEETDSIQWAVEDLRAQYAIFMSDEFTKEMAKAMHTSDKVGLAYVVSEYSEKLHLINQSLISRSDEAEADKGFEDAIFRHEERAATGLTVEGMTFGMPEIDNFIYGVRPKEICTFAAKTGGGKSWFAGKTTLAEFENDRRAVLFTLENDLEMTYDRLACQAAYVDYGRWQQGKATPEEIERIRGYLDRLAKSDYKPLIIEPQASERSPDALVRRALMEDADSIIVDQLSFVNRVAATARAAREDSVIGDKMRRFKELISDASKPMPLLMLHQMKRVGVERAQKDGRYVAEDMAGGAEVERISVFVFGLFQSLDHEIAGRAELQMLKSRRTPRNNWELQWDVGVGDIRVLQELGNRG